MFVTRLISGIILLILALFLLYSGGNLLFLVSLILSLIGLFEVYRVTKIEKQIPAAIGYAAVVVYYVMIYFGRTDLLTLYTIALVLSLMAVYVFAFPKYKYRDIASACMSVFYVGIMFSHVYQVRSLPDGFYLVWLILIGSWGSDTCAYCVGMLIGKHKLAPQLSPKKTIEGALGGIAGAALIGYLYGMLVASNLELIASPAMTSALACAIGAVISQIGDLAASAIKRDYETKDYGHLIPGHGGVMDRFDSMIFTAPAIYFAVLFIGMM